jgi:hypothetical protein
VNVSQLKLRSEKFDDDNDDDDDNNNNNNNNIKMCFDLVYNFCLKTCYSKRTEQDMIINRYCSPCKVRITAVRVHRNLNFDTFFKNTQVSYFMKIRPVGTELFHGDG